jgi:hypothetical protein
MAGALTISTLNNDTGVLATQNGMTGICKAWINFNGTGTPAIRGSFNVSSITDNGTGLYTLNFTNALPNTDYAIMGTANNTNSTWGALVCLAGDAALQSPIKSTTQAKVFVNFTGGSVDVEQVSVAVFSS